MDLERRFSGLDRLYQTDAMAQLAKCHVVVIGVGGSFDVISGQVQRAPVFFQKLGLEWLWRLLKEPWRWKRMLALPKFTILVKKTKRKKLV